MPSDHPLLLLIDDHEDTRASAAELLVRCGFRVEMANGGEDGLAMAAALRPDVIVTDLIMPVVDGYAVCARLKREVTTRDIPLVVYTGVTDRHALTRLSRLGVDAFAIKPCIPTVVGRVAHGAIARRALGDGERPPPSVVTGYGEVLAGLVE